MILYETNEQWNHTSGIGASENSRFGLESPGFFSGRGRSLLLLRMRIVTRGDASGRRHTRTDHRIIYEALPFCLARFIRFVGVPDGCGWRWGGIRLSGRRGRGGHHQIPTEQGERRGMTEFQFCSLETRIIGREQLLSTAVPSQSISRYIRRFGNFYFHFHWKWNQLIR